MSYEYLTKTQVHENMNSPDSGNSANSDSIREAKERSYPWTNRVVSASSRCHLRILFCHFLNCILENTTLCSRKGHITTLRIISASSQRHLSVVSALSQRHLRIFFFVISSIILWKMLHCVLGKGSSRLHKPSLTQTPNIHATAFIFISAYAYIHISAAQLSEIIFWWSISFRLVITFKSLVVSFLFIFKTEKMTALFDDIQSILFAPGSRRWGLQFENQYKPTS